MRKFFVILLLICLSSATFGQISSIKGTIRDTSDKKNLINAVVTLLRGSDSMLIKFNRTDSHGNFAINNVAEGEYVLMVTYPKFADYADKIKLSGAQTDLGIIPLTPKSLLLQEVVVRNNRAINIKGDTTEFTADSFKVKEGATVEDLLKQIPGMQVNSKGEITAQGKRVDKVLVDGEEFFGADPTIATQNIGAKAVDKVQVFDTKTEQDQLKGIGSTGDGNKTINIKLKESAKKGYFGRAEGGTDFDKILNGKLMYNRFRSNKKLSIYGTKSNTNTGSLGWEDRDKLGLENNDFEYDEISGFYYSYGDYDNEFNDWNLRGIPNAYTAGSLYSNKWNEEKNKFNISYLYNRLGTNNTTTTVSQTFLGDTTTYNNSIAKAKALSQRHTATGKYEWKIDSFSTIKYNVNGKYNLKHSYTENYSEELNQDQQFINKNARNTDQNATKKQLDNILTYNRLFHKKNRQLIATLRLGLVDDDQTNQLYSTAQFYKNGVVDSTEIVDQLKTYAGKSTTFGTKITYNEPWSSKWNLVTEYSLNANIASSYRNSYDKDANLKYTQLDQLYSNNFDMDAISNSGTITARYQGSKLRAAIGTGLSSIQLHLHDLDLKNNTRYDFTRVTPQAQIGYKFKPQSGFSFGYRGSTVQPSLTQLQPLRDNSKPLNVYVGNPGLRVGFNHSMNIGFNDFKVLKGRYIFTNFSFNTVRNAITNLTQYDLATGKTTYMPVNVNGNYNWYWWGVWNSGDGNGKLSSEIQPQANGGRNINFINGNKNTNTYATVTLNYRLRRYVQEKYNWSVGPYIQRNLSKSSISSAGSSNNYWTVGGRGDGYVKLFKTWELSSDVDAKFQQKTSTFTKAANIVVWNAEFSKKFFKDKSLKVGVMAHDILNQNIGFNRTINSNFMSEERYDRIARYFLLNISWTFNKMPGKE